MTAEPRSPRPARARCLGPFDLIVAALVAWAACPQAGRAAPDPGNPMVMSELVVTKRSYAEREPIEARLTISNPGTMPIVTVVNYPRFRTSNSEGLRFEAGAASLAARPIGAREALAEDFGGEMPIVSIPAGGSWSVKLYLQRFVADPKPGRYKLPYRLDLAYYDKLPGGTRLDLSSVGTLEFTVDPARPSALEDSMQRYEEGLRDEDFWRRSEAAEALSVIADPSVVPHLKTMLAVGLPETGLDALERFPEDERARAAVLDALGSDRSPIVVRALEILGAWKSEISPEDLARLSARGDGEIGRAILEYRRDVRKD